MAWYTKHTWTNKDEEEFFTRLKRAKEFKKPQYLKTQAFVLIGTNEPELLNVAEVLLNRVLQQYPHDTFNKSSALNLLGDINLKRNNIQTALNYYKASIDFERNNPNTPHTPSYISYSELIIKTKQTDKYTQVENLIFERMNSVILPIQKYKLASILSVIYQTKKNYRLARHYAEIAEKNATAETSGFRYHKSLGLVEQRLKWLDKLVRRK